MFLYCIEHECMEKVQNSPFGYIHEYVTWSDFGFTDLDWCAFDLGYATCPEPEYDNDWDLNLVEPSEEELLPMEMYDQ